jgi:hypothetical protein
VKSVNDSYAAIAETKGQECAPIVQRRFHMTPSTFLLCCTESLEEKQTEEKLERRFREVNEGDYETEQERQAALDGVQEELKEYRNDRYDKSKILVRSRSCLDCGSENIGLFPDFVMRIFRFHCKCCDCGAEWIRQQEIV